MRGFLSLVLHAHLPFVRHPEHGRFLEESWLFEAITESYIPLLQILERWQQDGVRARLTLTLTPPLCAMLTDPLLGRRYRRHLDDLLLLVEKETHRTTWERPFYELAVFYQKRLLSIRKYYESCQGQLLARFRKLQDADQIQIITSAATHALLPLLANDSAALRAQILVARDHYQTCFGRVPTGIWLPECAYTESLEPVLKEAGLRWFITDSHGLLHASPRPRYATFAPILTPAGLAAFGRDADSAKQVWSRHEGYPGDPRYRDFYRDIGFDLDLDYLQSCFPVPAQRGFTGIKYHRITGGTEAKAPYERASALEAADEHAAHFLSARMAQIQRAADILQRAPLVVAPYDAELFGHWWFEGPEFLDLFVRKAFYDQQVFGFCTPEDYLGRFPTQQVASPAASSWGEGGYWRVWLDETNAWIYPHLHAAQQRMSELARRFSSPVGSAGEQTQAPSARIPVSDGAQGPTPLQLRTLKQAARELLLAQSSDWAFILRTGTSPDYARKRVTDHLLRFNKLYEQLLGGHIDEPWLGSIEQADNLFPEIDFRYWC